MPGTKNGGSDRTADLEALARGWKVSCDLEQTRALVRYAELLMLWNARINLTGASSVAALIGDHFPDAFALAGQLADPGRAVDVGSGGGLPALPLAILRPRLTLELCEPLGKKVAFLRTAVRELELGDRVAILPQRAEAVAAGGGRCFDVGLSRATLAPPDWIDLARRLVRPGGRIFVLTTPRTSIGTSGAAWSVTYGGGARRLVEVTA